MAIPAIICICACIAYYNSFNGPFVFDDIQAIVENPSIQDMSDVSAIFFPPLSATGAVGRPLVNASFALNHAAFDTDVRGYHATNLLIHLFASLLLFGVLRRTFLRASSVPLRGHAAHLAGAVALLWSVHPLLTESVTAVVQRNESMAGMFMLGTFYGFLRSLESKSIRLWLGIAVGSCLLGTASKEITAVCPVLLVIYDRLFVAERASQLWGKRKWFYVSLFATYGLLLYLVFHTEGRNQTVGFDLGISWWQYLCTQCAGIPRYLGLAFWPVNLVFDYGNAIVVSPIKVIPGAVLLVALVGATVWVLFRKSQLGFLGIWFFVILAPSSSILPLTSQTLAEHRMYLPLISVIVAVVLLLHYVLQRRWWIAVVCLAPLLMVRTVSRNNDYSSAMCIWSDTVQKVPLNPRAHNGVGIAYSALGDEAAAASSFQRAVQQAPENASYQYNLGSSLLSLGNPDGAIAAFQKAVQFRPEYEKAHNDLGNALAMVHRYSDALAHFQRAARLNAQSPMVWMNLANTYVAVQQYDKAASAYQRVLTLEPDNPEARQNLRYLQKKRQR
ncbi:MAG: tetratricopeptide repeat protein [Deltaproteobacteria bacterium]|nr:tetratricopeptide repeat protein [Deltaproteobacteria bacterium]MBN2674065.1 tetratricopeptide repeat protein [Deltaproteobacteria bacterium]